MSIFSDFIFLRQEISMVAILLFILLADIFSGSENKKWLPPTMYVLFALHIIGGFLCVPTGEAFGGLYVSSTVTVLTKNLLAIGTLLVLLQTHQRISQPDNIHKCGEFFVILLTTLLGMYLMVSAGNFMMLYIGIETASLPVACLAAFDKCRKKSAEAGVKYILISAFSSAIMLFGISYIYGFSSTMYFEDLPKLLTDAPVVLLGTIFFIAGLAFKISLVPFHLWTADVYEGSPTGVTAYLSVISKGAAVFTLLFVLWKVFGIMLNDVLHYVLWALAAVTITVGNLFAIRQTDIKRFFAFSSISQAGYILLGVMSGSAHGMASVVYYVLAYIASNLAAFGVIAAVENKSDRTDIAAYNGLYKTNPVLSFVMMIAVFSLAGIPPFAGFFSKFFIFSAAIGQGEYILVFIALLNTVISLYYYLLIVRAMFINSQNEPSVGAIRIDNYNRCSMVFCMIGILALGIVSAAYNYFEKISFGV